MPALHDDDPDQGDALPGLLRGPAQGVKHGQDRNTKDTKDTKKSILFEERQRAVFQENSFVFFVSFVFVFLRALTTM
jgi:hypothetical protein